MTSTRQPHPHEKCHECHVFFKCEQLPPCATHASAPAPEPDHKAPICENCGLDNTTCRMDMAGCLQAQNAAAKAERERAQQGNNNRMEQ